MSYVICPVWLLCLLVKLALPHKSFKPHQDEKSWFDFLQAKKSYVMGLIGLQHMVDAYDVLQLGPQSTGFLGTTSVGYENAMTNMPMAHCKLGY